MSGSAGHGMGMTMVANGGRVLVVVAISVAAVCGGSGGGGDLVDPPLGSVATIEVSPTPLNLSVGGSGSLVAIARDKSGTVLGQTSFAWSSAASSIASVVGAASVGQVSGLIPGTTRVTARAGAIEGSAVVNVQQQSALILQVVPAVSGTTVGGSVAFTVIAKDANGVIQPAPAVTAWTSSSQSVATITSGGIATGRAVGTTQIGASAGVLVATPAVLSVSSQAGACDNIASISSWSIDLTWKWARNSTNSSNHRIAADHSGNFKSTFVRQVTTNTLVRYTSDPGGNGSVNDADTDLNGSVPHTRTLRGGGGIASANLGVPLPGFTLDIDLTTCTYQFFGSASITMTLTESDGRAETGTLPLGTISSAPSPVGDWRKLGLSDLGGQFPAHTLGWLLGGQIGKAYYIPFGFGPLVWGNAGPAEAPEGDASVSWAITVK